MYSVCSDYSRLVVDFQDYFFPLNGIFYGYMLSAIEIGLNSGSYTTPS